MRKTLTAALFITLILSVPAFGQLVFPDGSQQVRAAADFERVVFVPAEGTSTQNGTALLSVLSNIGDAALSNQYLIQLDIGAYDLGASTLTSKAFVEIRGLGQELTSITSSGSSTLVLTTNSELQAVTLHNSGNNTSVLTATCVECNLVSATVEHTGVAGGTNTGISVQGGAELLVQSSAIFITAANTGGTNCGINVTGAGSTVIMWLSEVATESESSGTVFGMIVGANAFGELYSSGIDTSEGDSDTAIQVAATGECTLDHSGIEGATALSNSGTATALATDFQGTRSGGGSTTYALCADGTGVLRPIIDTNSAIP